MPPKTTTASNSTLAHWGLRYLASKSPYCLSEIVILVIRRGAACRAHPKSKTQKAVGPKHTHGLHRRQQKDRGLQRSRHGQPVRSAQKPNGKWADSSLV